MQRLVVTCGCLVLAPLLFFITPSNAAEGDRKVELHTVVTDDERSFILNWMPFLASKTSDDFWLQRLKNGQVHLGEIDINQDGTPERFVMSDAPEDKEKYGYPTHLLWQVRGQWQMIFTGHSQGKELIIPPKSHNHIYHVYFTNISLRFDFIDGDEIPFHVVTSPEEKKFALQALLNDAYMSGDERLEKQPDGEYKSLKPRIFWPRAVERGDIRWGEADLDGDGVNERFIMAEVGELCGNDAGCETVILRKGKNGWKNVATTQLHEHGTYVLHETRFGWHRLYASLSIISFKNGRSFESEDLETGEITR